MTFNKFLKRSSVFSLAFAGMVMVAYACGWYPDESDFLSFMPPSVVNQPKTEHLQYEPSYQFYWKTMADSYEQRATQYTDSNEYEWKKYMGTEVSVEDINEVVSKLPAMAFDDLLAAINRKKKWEVPDFLDSNRMLPWLMQKKNRPALDYLAFAKQTQVISDREYNPWDPQPSDTAKALQFLQESLKRYAATKDDFLKARYAFQAMKAAFYGDQYNTCVDLWASHAQAVQGRCPSLDQRMLSYKAGALYRSGRKAEAAYMFSKMFDQTNDLYASYGHSLGFVWSKTETPVDAVIPFCLNAHERSVVYAMYGMRDVEPFQTSAIEKTFSEDPSNPMLDVLLLREINKAELAYLTMRVDIERGYYVYDGWTGGPVFGLNEETTQSDLFKKNGVPQPLQSLSAYVNRMVKTMNVANPALWKMSAGYLSYMCEDYNNAQYWYNQTARSNPSPAIQNQLKVLNLLNELRQSNLVPMAKEQKLLSGLEQVEALSKSDPNYLPVFRNVLRSELPAYFVRKNDTIRMMLSYHRFENTYNEPEANKNETVAHFNQFSFLNSGTWMNKYFSQNQLDEVVAMQRNNANALDQWLLQGNQYDQRLINELKGVKYFRAFDYEKALSILKGQQDLPTVPDIFHMYVNDYQDIGENQMEQEYTTAEVLQQLIELKKKAPLDPFSAYRYACVLYSLSYHGRCHDAWNFYRDYTDVTPYYYSNDNGMYTPFEKQYYYADEAYAWFRKAYEKSTDPYIKQNALWMMAKCEQKRCPLEPGNPYWNNDDAKTYVSWSVNQNPWLNLFHKKYKGTPFYNKVYEECAYLQLFASKQQ